LGEIVVAWVATFKWEVLSSMNMLIIFDLNSPLVSGAKLDSCSYEIMDEKNKLIDKGEAKIARLTVNRVFQAKAHKIFTVVTQ
jgi:hypothetical protein